jgi:hypothetical protein
MRTARGARAARGLRSSGISIAAGEAMLVRDTAAVAGILAIGIYPTPLFQAAGNAARVLLQQ